MKNYYVFLYHFALLLDFSLQLPLFVQELDLALFGAIFLFELDLGEQQRLSLIQVRAHDHLLIAGYAFVVE